MMRLAEGYLDVFVRVTPKTSRDEISGPVVDADGAHSLAVRVRAVPDKGAANKAVTGVFAKWAGCPKQAIHVVRGATSRNKTLRVTASVDCLNRVRRQLEMLANGG